MPEPDSSIDPIDSPGEEPLEDALATRSAFARALSRGGFADVLVLGRDRAAEVFHPRRLEICDHLREHDPASVRGLATALDRDPGLISRDLGRLAELGVVELEPDGRALVPRLAARHVVVEPVV